MDTLHTVMRSIRGETKTRRDHLSVFREFLDHLDRVTRARVRGRGRRGAQRRSATARPARRAASASDKPQSSPASAALLPPRLRGRGGEGSSLHESLYRAPSLTLPRKRERGHALSARHRLRRATNRLRNDDFHAHPDCSASLQCSPTLPARGGRRKTHACTSRTHARRVFAPRTTIAPDGTVEGYASLFGEIDQARDMVMAGRVPGNAEAARRAPHPDAVPARSGGADRRSGTNSSKTCAVCSRAGGSFRRCSAAARCWHW